MLHLTQNSYNTIIVTATERLTFNVIDGYYIVLSRNNVDEQTITLGDEQSGYTERYNKFTFELPDLGFTTKGNVQFNYKIIAVDNNDNSEVLEQGFCYVYVLEDTSIFTQRDSTNIFIQPQ